MLIIRLQRVGRKNDPSFRVIVTEHTRAAKASQALEVLGAYDARATAKGSNRPVQIKTERVKYWLSVGAQVSGTVHNLLIDAKILTGKKINVLPRKTPIQSETKPEEKTEEKVAEPVAEEAVATV